MFVSHGQQVPPGQGCAAELPLQGVVLKWIGCSNKSHFHCYIYTSGVPSLLSEITSKWISTQFQLSVEKKVKMHTEQKVLSTELDKRNPTRGLSSLCFFLMELCKKALSSTSHKPPPVSQTPTGWRIVLDLNQSRGNQSALTLHVEGSNWMILALCGLWPGLSA